MTKQKSQQQPQLKPVQFAWLVVSIVSYITLVWHFCTLYHCAWAIVILVQLPLHVYAMCRMAQHKKSMAAEGK